MSPVQNKAYIDKCIVSFSHDRYPSRLAADKASLDKARREIAAGKRGVSHLILRAADDPIDRLKFLFLIDGIPIMCYALTNLIYSSLREIVVIGSSEVKRVLDSFLDTVGANGKTVRFAPECPENLSLMNTLNLGRSELSLDTAELVLFQPGDLPFLWDLEKILQDKDIEQHNLILWLNAREKMFPRCKEDPESEFVIRNYHYRMIDEEAGELLDTKEPNVYPINLAAVEADIIELLHLSRKDGKIFKAGIKKALRHPARFLRLLPVLTNQLLHFRSDLKRFRMQDDYQFGMRKNSFHRGASILLDTPFTSKVHDDPAFVADVDALEDWEDYESLTHYAKQQHGEEGLSTIYPYAMELLRFKEKAMPELKKHIPMYADFPGYMNNLYRTLHMPCIPFDQKGNYIKSGEDGAKAENAFRWYSQRTRHLSQCT